MNIAIIGAGLAGITLANELNEKGLHTTVFEKSRGKGGRISSKRLSFANVDTGAQYFTVRDERFVLAVERWKKLGKIAKWEFQPHTIGKLNDNPYLKTSPDDIDRYVGIPTMNAFIKEQAKNLNIELNTQINGISKKDQKWQLWSGDSDNKHLVGTFDWVISTAPAEQSRQLFSDNLEVQKKIPKAIHSPCWALVLATKGQVPQSIQGFFGDDNVSWVSRDSSKPARTLAAETPINQDLLDKSLQQQEFDDLWVMHFSEQWTQNNVQASESDMESFGFQWLSNTLNNTVLLQPNDYQPLQGVYLTLEHSYRHFWRYARFDKANDVPNEIIFDSNNKVAVIGDWCLGGRVENAYLAALECAEQLLMEL